MKMKIFIGSVLFLCMIVNGVFSTEWWEYYKNAKRLAEAQKWEEAINEYLNAICLNDTDRSRARTYGMHFIEYFPHRELGIAYYNLGDLKRAEMELQKSLSLEKSVRAYEYLEKIKGGFIPSTPAAISTSTITVTSSNITPPPPKQSIRHRIAVLDFESIGASETLGRAVAENFRTSIGDTKMYYLVERAFLQKVLDQQKLQLSGAVDPETAVKIGQLVQAKYVVVGSLTKMGSTYTLNVRFTDVETSANVLSKQLKCGSEDEIPNMIQSMVNNLKYERIE
jgi:tetratricopeptide (TPR) repeat protein